MAAWSWSVARREPTGSAECCDAPRAATEAPATLGCGDVGGAECVVQKMPPVPATRRNATRGRRWQRTHDPAPKSHAVTAMDSSRTSRSTAVDGESDSSTTAPRSSSSSRPPSLIGTSQVNGSLGLGAHRRQPITRPTRPPRLLLVGAWHALATEDTRARIGNAMTYRPSDVRAWAQETGEPVAGRGRLSYDVVTAYLMANPQVTRGLAVEHGLHISTRGRVSRATCEELAVLVR